MVSLLIDAEFDESTITLRTGHRNIASLRNYHNLRGRIGLDQLNRMFTDNGSLKKGIVHETVHQNESGHGNEIPRGIKDMNFPTEMKTIECGCR